jgi:hypothetical protein
MRTRRKREHCSFGSQVCPDGLRAGQLSHHSLARVVVMMDDDARQDARRERRHTRRRDASK